MSRDMPTHGHFQAEFCSPLCPAFGATAAFYPSRVTPKSDFDAVMKEIHGQEDTALAKAPLRDRTSAERKGEPIHGGVLLYFPDALAAVARISKAGNDKHNPGEPLHWARGKSMDQMDALTRHSLTMSKLDPETGEIEAAAAAWRALAQLQLLEEKRLKAAGILPYSGIVP